MGLLYHRPIRYMVLQSFKICANAFIFDVVKTVGTRVIFQSLELYGSLCLCFRCNEEIEVLNWR
jgi:hypothetical protein